MNSSESAAKASYFIHFTGEPLSPSHQPGEKMNLEQNIAIYVLFCQCKVFKNVFVGVAMKKFIMNRRKEARLKP